MKIKDILKAVGVDVVRSHPAGKAAIALINGFLPDDKKLGPNATGTEAADAVNGMPSELSHALAMAEVNLEVERERGRTSRYDSMCKSDGQETRAKIVDKAMNTLIGLSFIFVAAVAYVYINDGAEAAFSYEMGFTFGIVTATFAYVVRAYFGDLRTETESRHTLFDSKPRSGKGIAGIVSAIKN